MWFGEGKMEAINIEDFQKNLRSKYDEIWDINKYALHEPIAESSKNTVLTPFERCKRILKDELNFQGLDEELISNFIRLEQEDSTRKILLDDTIKTEEIKKNILNSYFLEKLMWKWNYDTVAIIPIMVSCDWRLNKKMGGYIKNNRYNLGTIGEHNYFEVSSQSVKEFKNKFIIYDKSHTWKYVKIDNEGAKDSHRLGVKIKTEDTHFEIKLKTQNIINYDPEHLKIFVLKD